MALQMDYPVRGEREVYAPKPAVEALWMDVAMIPSAKMTPRIDEHGVRLMIGTVEHGIVLRLRGGLAQLEAWADALAAAVGAERAAMQAEDSR